MKTTAPNQGSVRDDRLSVAGRGLARALQGSSPGMETGAGRLSHLRRYDRILCAVLLAGTALLAGCNPAKDEA